jgi:hypothetical protein
VLEGLVEGNLVVCAAGESRVHKAGNERGRLLEEAVERAGLEGLGKREEQGGVQSTEGGKVGEEAAEDHVRLVLDLDRLRCRAPLPTELEQ